MLEHIESNIAETTAATMLGEAYEMLASAGKDPMKKHEAVKRLCEAMITWDSAKRDLVIEQVSKDYKVSKKIIKDVMKEYTAGTAIRETDFMADDKVAEMDNFGFYEENNTYKFLTKDGIIPGSNFTIKPLFHIYSKTDNKRLVEITNEHGASRIVDIPSKSFVSFEQFQQVAFQEGNYLFFGSRFHFLKILNKISNDFPVCNELKTLGWQREGFYAFANGIYKDAWQPVDEYGITQHNNKKFFSPAFSTVYADVREDDDEYENDRFFIFIKPEITFNQWCQHMKKVYTDKAPWGIAFLVTSLFRDIIYDKFKFFPHLFLFGQPQSGKSALAWSLSNVFFKNLPAFNLNSGTNVGFFRRLARFRNTISWFDEFSNDIDIKRFQALKAAYDGIGHEKGKTTKDNRTEITKINAASIISGQYLPTADDNALFTRSIMLSFPKRDIDNPFTEEEVTNLNEIRIIEKEGLSGILTEILAYRQEIEDDYPLVFTIVYNEIKEYFVNKKKNYTERIILNYVCILTIVKIFDNIKAINFGFDYRELFNKSIDMIIKQSAQISDSDALASFWGTIQFLFETHQLTAGEDFKISYRDSIKISDPNIADRTISFKHPKKLLFIRFTKIHPLYLEAHRKQHGTTGVDITSLKHYLSNSKAYFGRISSERFTSSNTSAFVFDYEVLGVNMGENVEDNMLESINNQSIPQQKPGDNGLPF